MRATATPTLDGLGKPEFTITRRSRMNLTPHYVYVVYGPGDWVLYVGQTRNVPGRMSAHRKLAEWWSLYRRIECYRCESRRNALDTERTLISELRPTYNVHGGLYPRFATSVSGAFAEVGEESVDGNAA